MLSTALRFSESAIVIMVCCLVKMKGAVVEWWRGNEGRLVDSWIGLIPAMATATATFYLLREVSSRKEREI